MMAEVTELAGSIADYETGMEYVAGEHSKAVSRKGYRIEMRNAKDGFRSLKAMRYLRIYRHQPRGSISFGIITAIP